jgi:DnaJ-class molecular chaperone
MALLNHPKNDPTPEAATRFAEAAKAYETIVDSRKNKTYEDFGFGSFFEDF